MGPGHPRIESTFSPCISLNSGPFGPKLGLLVSGHLLSQNAPHGSRPRVPGPCYLRFLARCRLRCRPESRPPSWSATGWSCPRQERVPAAPTPRALVPGIPKDATAPRSCPHDAVLGPVVLLPRPRHRAHLIIFPRQAPRSDATLGITRSARGIMTART